MKHVILRKPRAFLLALSLCLFVQLVPAQERTISGNVTTTIGESIVGATILLKGTTNGTITDLDGNFQLIVPGNDAVLNVSYVGYKQQDVEVGNKNLLKIVLEEDAHLLGEMVVVGYGSQKKLSVTGSVGNIKSEDLSRTTSTTTAGAMVGKVAGITNRSAGDAYPGSSVSLEIRNFGTPLYVIDGVISDAGQFNNINVTDIEDISILKDGTAAIYGLKASNGVVLVTTKKGARNTKPKVNLTAYYGWQSWTRFPEPANAADYMRAVAEGDMNTNGTTSITPEILEKWRIGGKDETGDYRGFNWMQYARDNVPQSYLNGSVSGGRENVSYYFSLSRIDQDAVFKDFTFNRTNIQSNIDVNITDNLKMGVMINGRIESRDNPGVSGVDDYWQLRYGLYQNLPTERPFANDNPNYPQQLKNNETNHAVNDKEHSGEFRSDWRVFQGSWNAEYKFPFLKGLKANAMFSYYYAQHHRTNFEKTYQTYSYDVENDSYIPAYKNTATWLVKEQANVESSNFQFTLSYDKSWQKHSLSAVLGVEGAQYKRKMTELDQNPVDNNYIQVFPENDFTNMRYVFDKSFDSATAGYLGRINYTYADKYILQLSGRYDGSYRFAKGQRWGFFPSVSAGWRIGEEQFFKENLGHIISNLKLRASYGQMGDENIFGINEYGQSADGWGYDAFAFLSGYNYGGTQSVIASDPTSGGVTGSNIKGASMRNIAVTNLSWIRTKIFDVGIDLGFFNNKLSMEFDYFHRKRDGLVDRRNDVILPAEMGFDLPPENLNSDYHTGVDGFIRWNDAVDDFKYSIGVNATLARKKDGFSYNDLRYNSWDKYRYSTQNRWAYINWGYEIEGQFASMEQIESHPVDIDGQRNKTLLPGDLIYKDVNGDGVINDYDQRPIGYAQEALPYLTFGLNLGFEWKGLDLTCDFAGGSMQSIMQDWEARWPFQGDGNSPSYILNDRWHHEDIFDLSSPWVPGKYPAIRNQASGLSSYNRSSTFWQTNVTYIRLKNLEIGYTLPQKWTRKVKIDRCRFFVNGSNLFSIDNLRSLGMDPEVAVGSGLNYPTHRIYNIGFNLSI